MGEEDEVPVWEEVQRLCSVIDLCGGAPFVQ
jgi:hypothetical protein